MLDHLATYFLAYLLTFAAIVVGVCIYRDKKAGYISSPFHK